MPQDSLNISWQLRPERNRRRLWLLILLAVAYALLLRFLPALNISALTGNPMLVGSIGIALGLFICAHPAANGVNMLFFERQALRQSSSDWPLVRWLVVFLGLTRLLDPGTSSG